MTDEPGSNQHVARFGGRQAMPPDVKRARGDRVRRLRELLKMTQQQLADEAGLAREVISKFESGANAASTADAQRALAKGFRVGVDDLALYLQGTLDAASLVHEVINQSVISQPGKPRVVAEDLVEAAQLDALIDEDIRSRHGLHELKQLLARPGMRERWPAAAIQAAQVRASSSDLAPGIEFWIAQLDRYASALQLAEIPYPPNAQPPPPKAEGQHLRMAVAEEAYERMRRAKARSKAQEINAKRFKRDGKV